MKGKLSGKILNEGLCICDICGKKSKLGGFINPMSPSPQVACYDCMIETTANAKGISVDAATKQRNASLRVTNIFIDCKMKEYVAAAKKSSLDNINEANAILHYITNVWNTFDKKEKGMMEKKNEEELAALFRNIKMNWGYLVEKQPQKRNEPCRCGSGRKYKACCLMGEEKEKKDLEKWKLFDTWVIRKGMIMIEESSELNIIDLFEFYCGRKRAADAKRYGLAERDMEEFHEWLMNDYIAPGESTPYVLGRLLAQGNLSGDERKLVEGRIAAPKSPYIITFIQKGQGALLRNVFDHEEVFVHDAMMSESTRPGCAVFLRIFAAGKYHFVSGGYMAYPPMYLDERLKEILKAYKKSGQTDGVNRFLRHNGNLFGRLL